MEKKIKAMFFNGSPRKNKNTADMLQSAMRGAEAAGAETELVHLYDIDLKNAYELGKRLAEKIFDLRPTPPILKHFDLITGNTGDGFVGERFKKQPGSM